MRRLFPILFCLIFVYMLLGVAAPLRAESSLANLGMGINDESYQDSVNPIQANEVQNDGYGTQVGDEAGGGNDAQAVAGLPSADEAYQDGAGVGELTDANSATEAATGVPVPASGSSGSSWRSNLPDNGSVSHVGLGTIVRLGPISSSTRTKSR